MLENNTNTPERKNPFFEPYNTPHDTVPFNRIKTSDYEEAFMEGIRRDDEAIEKLVNDPEPPTFENTIVRVDNENGGPAGAKTQPYSDKARQRREAQPTPL